MIEALQWFGIWLLGILGQPFVLGIGVLLIASGVNRIGSEMKKARRLAERREERGPQRVSVQSSESDDPFAQ